MAGNRPGGPPAGGAWITTDVSGGNCVVPGLAPVQLPRRRNGHRGHRPFFHRHLGHIVIELAASYEVDSGVKIVANGSSAAVPASGESSRPTNAVIDNWNMQLLRLRRVAAVRRDDLKIPVPHHDHVIGAAGRCRTAEREGSSSLVTTVRRAAVAAFDVLQVGDCSPRARAAPPSCARVPGWTRSSCVEVVNSIGG